ncbi:putative transposase-like protein [Thelohanellus kitauei]|uniref:Putative transposase-like protein n=1 Tax=Thelohanellus kitauei TaxID=669202 RepID=A0A0C2J4P1_THEKT|nr:putative transposase-like protein [Thelohanellus kitauei]
MLSYFWLSGANNKQIEMYTGHCKSTVTHHKRFLIQLVSDSLDFIDLQIGGENVIVEIDETKMGKNKHRRGHSVNWAWVLGGVERTEEHRVFLVEVPDRTEATLLGIIRTYVLPLSIIMTDCFRSYHNFNEFYTHLTVNHSNTFKDPETGAHTNCIEGTWNTIKYQIPPRNRTNSLDDDGHVVENVLNDHLGEFEWRRKHSSDLWT